MKLSDEEQAQLDALTSKRDAPDEPAGGRSEQIAIHIDLSDEAAVQRAIDHGYLTRAEVKELEDADGEDADADAGDGKRKAKDDDAPKRRRGNMLTRGYGDD